MCYENEETVSSEDSAEVRLPTELGTHPTLMDLHQNAITNYSQERLSTIKNSFRSHIFNLKVLESEGLGDAKRCSMKFVSCSG